MKQRKPNRLKNYDYSKSGCYFVTICTDNRQHYFGEIINGEVMLNEHGRIAYDMWKGLLKVFENIALDIFVVMPNHMHGIIMIDNPPNEPVGDAYSEINNKNINSGKITTGRNESESPDMRPLQEIKRLQFNDNEGNDSNLIDMRPLQKIDRSKMFLCKIIQLYKSKVTRLINNKRRIKKIPEINIWQRSFYDRIIRSEKEFFNIQVYISENPARWQTDIENKLNKNPDKKYYENLFQ